jgi:hypothetical protein
MATEALKAAGITNLDATPVTPNTSGEGASGLMRVATDNVASTAGVTTGSTYKMVRIPTNAKIRKVLLTCAAHGGSAAFDVSVAYSDSTTDGTQPSLQNTIVQISSADNKLFGSAVSAVSALKHSDITFQNTFTSAHKNLPLYQVLINLGTTDFTADPKGFFDLVLKSTATDTSGGNLELQVEYVVGP